MITRTLIFISPYSLLSFFVGGFQLYPIYLLAPVGAFQLGRRIASAMLYGELSIKRITLWLTMSVAVVAAAALIKGFLLVDLLKISVMVSVIYYLVDYLRRYPDFDWRRLLDASLLILVGYGLFQYVTILSGNEAWAVRLHDLFGYEGTGGPYDTRGGILRVASLTREPSYFAFAVGIYAFVTRSILVRAVCVLGAVISFSLITFYAWFGVGVFVVFSRLFRVGFLPFAFGMAGLHLLVSLNLSAWVPETLLPTFEARYDALIYAISRFNAVEWIVGSWSVGLDDPATLYRPYSNIASVLLLFGVLGLVIYAVLFDLLRKRSRYPLAVVAMFLFGFNYYYLTAWPIVVVFFAVLFAVRREEVADGLPMERQYA